MWIFLSMKIIQRSRKWLPFFQNYTSYSQHSVISLTNDKYNHGQYSFQEDRLPVSYRFFSHFLDLRIISCKGRYTSSKMSLTFSQSQVNDLPQADTNMWNYKQEKKTIDCFTDKWFLDFLTKKITFTDRCGGESRV